jgi:hypothetical protein
VSGPLATVVDTTAPTFTSVSGDLTAEATSAAGAAVSYAAAIATDVVDASPTVDCAPASASTFAIGATTVTCTATDGQGNAATASFTVTVLDTSVPVVTITGAPAGPVEGNATGGATVAFSASAADIVDGHIGATCAQVSGSLFPVGTTTVTCTSTDAHGNTGSASFNVTVVDTSAPTFTSVSGNLAAEATSALGAAVSYAAATAADVVDGSPTVTCVPASGSTFVIGTTTVTCTATDGQGNATTASFTVTVVDTIAPSSITVTSFSPKLLWPPDGRIVNVTVTGEAFDAGSGVARIKWSVIDEYDTYKPTGFVDVPGNGPFTVVVPLLAERRGNDKDGRHYTIRLTAVDRRGNELLLPPAQAPVVNVHDQSGK